MWKFQLCTLSVLQHIKSTFFRSIYEHCAWFYLTSDDLYRCYSSSPAGDPGGKSPAAQTAAPSAPIWFSSSCQIIELESGPFSASGMPEPVTATLAGPGSWTEVRDSIKHDGARKYNVTRTLCDVKRIYLEGCRLHLAFLLLILFIGSRVYHQLLTPPEKKTKQRVFCICVYKLQPTLVYLMLQSSRRKATDPLMISLFSPLMKYSWSGVTMHREFFWPVFGSASMTSVQRFMFTVPWGSVLGYRRNVTNITSDYFISCVLASITSPFDKQLRERITTQFESNRHITQLSITTLGTNTSAIVEHKKDKCGKRNAWATVSNHVHCSVSISDWGLPD